MAKEKKEKKERKSLKQKRDKKDKKGRITKKGKEILAKELEKIEKEKQAGLDSMLSLSRTDRRQKKVAEKLRKKVVEYLERQTLMATVPIMKIGLVKGSPEHKKARAALEKAMAEEKAAKEMDWREILQNYKDKDLTIEKSEISIEGKPKKEKIDDEPKSKKGKKSSKKEEDIDDDENEEEEDFE